MELLGHDTLYTQRGVISGVSHKRFTSCRIYLDAYLRDSGAMLSIIKASTSIPLECHTNSWMYSVLIQNQYENNL